MLNKGDLKKSIHQYTTGDFIFGEYEVLKVFGGTGKSGMGVVYLVNSRDHSEPFVMKTNQVQFSDNNQSLFHRFIREAETWVSIGVHPNIVNAYWVRKLDNQIFIAAEYIPEDSEGRNTLTHFISQGAQPGERIANWSVQFCEGMEFARSFGIIAHRDIKPDNLMIAPDGTLKVTDFGLVRVEKITEIPQKINSHSQNKQPNLMKWTQSGSILGTLPFMAPEQFLFSLDVDYRADIYAFGIILHLLVTGGVYPYPIGHNPTQQSFVHAHLYEKNIPIKSIFSPIIEKCLCKDVTKRYKNFIDLRNAIQKISKKNRITIAPYFVNQDFTAENLYKKAQSYSALGNKNEALNFINEYVRLFPENYCGWTEKSRIHLEMGDTQSALIAARKSIESWQENPHAWNNLGVIYLRLSDWNNALDAFSRALLYDPYNTGSMMQKGVALTYIDRFGEAVQIFLKAIELRPTKKSLLLNASNMAALMLQKGYKEVDILLEKLTTIDADNINNWINLALHHQLSNRINDAIKCLIIAEKIDPNDSEVILLLAKLNSQIGDFQKALHYCDMLLIFPTQAENALLFKAQILNFMGRTDEAVNLLNTELEKDDKRDEIWFILAKLYAESGSKDLALYASMRCQQLLLRNPSSNHGNLRIITQLIQQLKK